ncbi:MAG TPA: NUDIX domain-containing protein [Anaerolineales bacterium]|jgi:8-oxo-dGTP diphosphatase|nr:NUDIX domain-containing protein [Anaerolineales bacterium]
MIQEIVGAMIVEAQMILLGQRAATRTFFPNVWDVFGGHMEPGEHQHETLVRELQEELGITPTKQTYLETLVVSIPKRRGVRAYQLHLYLYLVTAWSGTPVNRQLHEHASIQWFSLAQAVQLDLAHPTYPELFAKHLTPTTAPSG